MPTAKLSPARLTTLMLRPNRVITRKVPMTLMGMARETMTVLEMLLKNSSRTMTARVPPTKMFFFTRSMAQ